MESKEHEILSKMANEKKEVKQAAAVPIPSPGLLVVKAADQAGPKSDINNSPVMP